jgi:hypothetical protein
VLICVEVMGKPSNLGEVWYAEADEPEGPWKYARKIVTHDRYSFYNPKHHPFFDQEGGRVIYFEGLATTFSRPTGRRRRGMITTRYVSLGLKDPRLKLPAP